MNSPLRADRNTLFDSKGFKLKFKEQYGLGSYVVINGQSVQLSLDVASKLFDIPVSKQKEDSWLLGPKVGYTPTEVLTYSFWIALSSLLRSSLVRSIRQSL
jgi:hypothetical protein